MNRSYIYIYHPEIYKKIHGSNGSNAYIDGVSCAMDNQFYFRKFTSGLLDDGNDKTLVQIRSNYKWFGRFGVFSFFLFAIVMFIQFLNP